MKIKTVLVIFYTLLMPIILGLYLDGLASSFSQEYGTCPTDVAGLYETCFKASGWPLKTDYYRTSFNLEAEHPYYIFFNFVFWYLIAWIIFMGLKSLFIKLKNRINIQLSQNNKKVIMGFVVAFLLLISIYWIVGVVKSF